MPMDILFFATLLNGVTLATFDGCTLSMIERGATLFRGATVFGGAALLGVQFF